MSKLLEAVAAVSDANIKRMRERAIQHYSSLSGRPNGECETLYDAIKELLRHSARVSMAMPDHAVGVFIGTGRMNQAESNESMQALNALGLENGVVASVVSKDAWGVSAENCVIDFGGDLDGFVVVGGLDRLRDPARVDYEPDAKAACVSMDKMLDAKVISVMLSMQSHDAAGIDVALQNILDESKEYGRCDVVMEVSPQRHSISAVRVSNVHQMMGLRRILEESGRLIPVYAMERGNFKELDPFATPDNEPYKFSPSAQSAYFAHGDRVAMKRSMSSGGSAGTILDISNGSVTVEWDGGERTIYDMAEALMRLVSAPSPAHVLPANVLYATPGMKDDAIEMLSSFGIDPVSVYSLASHCRPTSAQSLGWREKMVAAMEGQGLRGGFVSGYVEGVDVFEPKEWFEARLPNGARLVIDASHSGLRILAGDAEEYVVPSEKHFKFE